MFELSKEVKLQWQVIVSEKGRPKQGFHIYKEGLRRVTVETRGQVSDDDMGA